MKKSVSAATHSPSVAKNALEMAAEESLSSLLHTMQSLSALYKLEIEALAQNNKAAFIALQPQKSDLTRQYELGVKEVQMRSTLIKTLAPQLRAALLLEHETLNKLALQSQMGCERIALSLNRIQDRLLAAARSVIKKDKATYTRPGAMLRDGAKPLATAINEAI